MENNTMNNHTKNKIRNSVIISNRKKDISRNVSLISWNGYAALPDIRNAHSVHDKGSRDITITSTKRQGLKEALARLYEGIDDE